MRDGVSGSAFGRVGGAPQTTVLSAGLCAVRTATVTGLPGSAEVPPHSVHVIPVRELPAC